MAGYADRLPARDGSTWLAARLSGFFPYVPSSLFFLAVGLLALAIRRPRYGSYLATVALVGLAVDTVHAVSMPRYLEYALPCAPLFVLFGVGAVLGSRRAEPSGAVVPSPFR